MAKGAAMAMGLTLALLQAGVAGAIGCAHGVTPECPRATKCVNGECVPSRFFDSDPTESFLTTPTTEDAPPPPPSAVKPRALVIRGRAFVDPKTGKTVLLQGANVVMKGAPWLPAVTNSSEICTDRWFSNYTCYGFSHADAAHFVAQGWNFIRLGVVWAGAQPTNEPKLDEAWVARLHALLDLAAQYGLYVVLDVHQDDIGVATCGEGAPMWFSELATPGRIGKPLRPLPGAGHEFPKFKDGKCHEHDTATWAQYAGQPDYNVKNECCTRYNGGGEAWSRLTFTWEAQETITYLFHNKKGRALYARYIGLLAAAVKDHPSAIGIETMNEPPSIERDAMYYTWQRCYEAAKAQVPDIAIGVMDTGEAPLPVRNLVLWPGQVRWLKNTNTLFYAFHYYSPLPLVSSAAKAVKNAVGFMKRWNVPALMTEFNSCGVKVPATANGIGWSYWEYSNFCDTPTRPGEPPKVCPPGGCKFGACITGVNGNSKANWTCPKHDDVEIYNDDDVDDVEIYA